MAHRSAPAVRATILAVVVILGGAVAALAADEPRARSAIDYGLFERAGIADAPECDLTASPGAEGPRVDFGADITNPAMTCPDAFAWFLFARAVSERFWASYGTDETMFPKEPWPACPGGDGDGCCAALEPFVPGEPVRHCPAYPGLAGPDGPAPVHAAFPPSKAHEVAGGARADGPDAPWNEIPPIERTMAIANRTVEVVYRNRPMFDYVLSRDLYHREGLARVFARAALSRRINAPFRADDRTARPDARGVLPVTRVDFPVASVMLKTNWLPVSAAPSVGIDLERHGPFVTVRLDPAEAPEGTEASDHVLLSLHVSSKAVPNWTWATFEHVSNQGRCDLIGCNDGFGYRAPAPADFEARLDGAVIEAARNYIAAGQVENAFDAGIDTFAFANRYAPGERTAALAALFDAFGIATGAPSPSAAADAVTAADPAWGMYRLKGTLADFVSPTGEPRIVGNSITEAGFSGSSSCITCHAQAAVDATGQMAFAIFSHRPSYLGFPESVNGAPNPARFAVEGRGPHAPGISTTLAVQTDFVWGFRFARPLAASPPAD